MKFSVRVRVLFSLVSTVLLSMLVAGWYLSTSIKEIIYNRARTELVAKSSMAKLMLEQSMNRLDYKQGRLFAGRLADVSGLRITIIRKDGVVVGDSDLSDRETALLENHKFRPEIIDAKRKKYGISIRYSKTVKHTMLYVAREFKTVKGTTGIIRVSRAVKEVELALHALYSALIVAGIIIFVFSFLMFIMVSSYYSGILKDLLSYAKDLASGKRKKVFVTPDKDLGGLTSSIKTLSENLESSLEDLAQERDRFGAVLDGMSEGVIALDREKRVVLINSAALMLLELGREPLGYSLLETMNLFSLSEIISRLNPGDNNSLEIDVDTDPLRKIYFRVSCTESGEYIIVLLDMTEIRRLENVRRDFVANVSHELRTPVSVVRANAETLMDGAIDDKIMGRKFLKSILINSERLTNLISDLLDIARIEEGCLTVKKEQCSIKSMLEHAKKSLETAAARKKQSVIVESEESLSVIADENIIGQILSNLLHNAIKYSGEGAVIILRGCKSKESILIEVEDNGPGIGEKERERLFERFYRVDTSRSRALGGTGLGLAIVKHLVIAMEGETGMRPSQTGGSIFWFTLPLITH